MPCLESDRLPKLKLDLDQAQSWGRFLNLGLNKMTLGFTKAWNGKNQNK